MTLEARKSGTFALFAHKIIETCVETPANIHGTKSYFFPPKNSSSKCREDDLILAGK